MKTEAQIQMNFNQAIQKAKELRSLAGQLDRLADQKLEETLWTLRKAWSGEASAQYQGKGRELKRKIKSSAEQLRKIADVITTSARATYNAEQEALRLARLRNR